MESREKLEGSYNLHPFQSQPLLSLISIPKCATLLASQLASTFHVAVFLLGAFLSAIQADSSIQRVQGSLTYRANIPSLLMPTSTLDSSLVLIYLWPFTASPLITSSRFSPSQWPLQNPNEQRKLTIDLSVPSAACTLTPSGRMHIGATIRHTYRRHK